MASLWQKALWALGLTDDEEPETDADENSAQAQVRTVESTTERPARSEGRPTQPGTRVPGRRVEPPASSRRVTSSNPQHAEAGVYVREGLASVTTPSGRGEVEVIPARTFSDAQLLADHIRAGTAVALDLRNAETTMVRRLVDFSSGLTYGLGGKMV
jgi:cell division inhibitor SepF